MAFEFDPSVSDAPLEAGDYEFTVASMVQKTSQSGNPMLELTLTTSTFNGEVTMKDWLVAARGGMWKLRQFCDVMGIDYKAGKVDPAAVVGRRIVGTIGVKADKNGREQCQVNGYSPPATGSIVNAGQVRKDAKVGAEDIPF